MDPSAIKPPSRPAVSRLDRQQRSGRIVAPIDGAITSRAPAPHLVHEDPRHSRRNTKGDSPDVAAEPESTAAGENAVATPFNTRKPALPFVSASDVLLLAAEHNAQSPAAAVCAYRLVPGEEDAHPHTDVEV